jgi:hypothetical protein
VVVINSTGLIAGGTVLLPIEYGRAPEKAGNIDTGFPSVRKAKVPVFAPEPPPMVALMNVIVEDV